MSKAENFTLRIDADLKRRMKAHPEINWSHVIREHIRSVLDDIERMDQLAAESELTEADVDDLAAMITAAAAERAQEDLAGDDLDGDASEGETDEDVTSRDRDVTDVDAT